MKVLICGSRGVKDALGFVYKAMVDARLLGIIPTSIIHGGARGIDSAGGIWAKDWAYLPIEVIKPDWDTYGKSAGFRRNLQMLDKCDAVVAVWDGKSKGTAHTITEAKKRKLPIFVLEVK